MRKLAVLLLSVSLTFLVGCGKAEIERLKADNETYEKKIWEVKDSARSEKERLKKESDNQISALSREKEQIARLLQEKDPKLAEAVRAQQKAEQEKADILRQMEETRKQLNTVQADLVTIRKEKEGAENLAKEAREEAGRLKSAKAAIASAEQKTTDAKAEVAKIAAESEALRQKIRDLSNSPAAGQKPDAFKNSTSIIIGFQPGQQDAAELMCKALGFKIVKIHGPDLGNRILCKWTRPITEETLKILDSCTSSIRYIQPDGPAPKGKSGSQRPPAQNSPPTIGGPGKVETIDNTYLERRWNLLSINAPAAKKALRSTIPSSPVIVAVIDSGIDTDHPDIKDHIYRKKGVSPRNFNDGEEDDDVSPGDKENKLQEDSNKDLAHGTHVAGIIVATANKQFATNGNVVQIMPLRIRTNGDVNTAILHAANHGARIINLSMSWKPHQNRDLAAVVKDVTMRPKPVLFVCAAGNDGENIDKVAHAQFPACIGRNYDDMNQRLVGWPNPAEFNVGRIIAVGAITPQSDGIRSPFSNYGTRTVDIWAPGGMGQLEELDDLSKHLPDKEILSTIPTTLATDDWKLTRTRGPAAPYAALWGTSQAAPHVSGAAALLMAIDPELSPEDVKDLLIQHSPRSVSPPSIPIAMAILLLTQMPQTTKTAPILDLRFVRTFLSRGKHESPTTQAHFNRGTDHFWRHEYQQSLHEFEQAISLYPANPAYHYFSAFSRACLGDLESATEDLEAALEIEKSTTTIDRWGVLMERLQGPNRDLIENLRRSFLNGSPLPEGSKLWANWGCSGPIFMQHGSLPPFGVPCVPFLWLSRLPCCL